MTPLQRLGGLLAALGPFMVLAGLVLIFELAVDGSFLSLIRVQYILVQTVIVAVAALGMTAIIISGGIDLSCGSNIALSGVVAALVMAGGHDPLTAIAAAVLTGAAVGLVNGGLVAGVGLVPFIVTLGTLSIARGTAKWLAKEASVNCDPGWISVLMQSTPGPSDPGWQQAMVVAPAAWLTVLLALIMILVMRTSVFGRHLYAIGSNEAAARLCGIRVGRTKILVYALAGCFFGLSGVLQMSRLSLGDSTAAVGMELDIIAAVIVGGASLSGGSGSILGTMIGALIMTVLRSGSSALGWPPYMQEIIIGSAIVVAVALDRMRIRARG